MIVLLFASCGQSDEQKMSAATEKVDIISGTHIVRAEERGKFEDVVENKDADITENQDEDIDIDSETLAENKKTETSKKEEQKKETTPVETIPAETTPSEPAHTHSYTSSVTKNATCIQNGVITYTCSCGDSYTETISATGQHNYERWTYIAPTCEQQGYEYYKCSMCQDEYYVYIDATGHSWSHHYQSINGVVNIYDTCWKCGGTAPCDENYSHCGLY